jgi:hypothetical protein
MNRELIYQGLTDLIPESKRRECVARNMVEMDILLDQLIEIQHSECFELLISEEEVGYGL